MIGFSADECSEDPAVTYSSRKDNDGTRTFENVQELVGVRVEFPRRSSSARRPNATDLTVVVRPELSKLELTQTIEDLLYLDTFHPLRVAINTQIGVA